MARCILITGMGHSGTRMLVHMLARHSQVSVPTESLNYVQEFYPLHRLFTQFIDQTPLHQDLYSADFGEVRFLLDAYMLAVDASKPYFVLKLPYHPLNCLDFVVDHFQGNIVLANARRPVEKIVQSFKRRGEDRKFFEDPLEHMRQVKKLEPAQRGRHLSLKDPDAFFRDVSSYCESKVHEWQERRPDFPFVDIEVEKVATSKDYLVGLLGRLGLSTHDADTMMTVVDQDRLLEGKQRELNAGGHGLRFKIKSFLKRLGA